MAVELATAYVSIVPSMKGTRSAIARELNAVAPIGVRTGRSLGSRFVSGFKRAVSRVARIGIYSAMAAIGAVGASAIKTSVELDTAKKSFEGLYGSAKVAKGVMEGIKDLSKKNPIDPTAYIEAGKTLAYMGVKGKDNVRILDGLGKVMITAGKGSEGMKSASAALLKMQNMGKVTLESFNQLSDSGVPILDALMERFGKSESQIRDMVSAGTIGLEDIMKEMKDQSGPIFQDMIKGADRAGNSLQNTFIKSKNRINIAFSELFGTSVQDALAKRLKGATDAVVRFMGQMKAGEGAGGRFADQMRSIGNTLKMVWDAISPIVKLLASHLDIIAKAIGAWVAYRLVVDSVIGVSRNMRNVMKTFQGVMFAYKTAVTNATLAWKLFGRAFITSPIGIAITAIIALGAALVIAYKKSETFRNIVNGAFNLLKAGVGGVVDWFKGNILPFFTKTIPNAFKVVLDWVKNNWGAILTLLGGPVGFAAMLIIKNWDKIKAAFVAAWNFIKPVLVAIKNYLSLVLGTAFRNFRIVASAVFRAISALISAKWNGVIKPVFLGIWRFIRATLGPVFRWLWNSVIKPVFTGIGIFLRGAWNNVIKPVFKAWWRFINGDLGPVFRWLWNSVIKPVFSGIKNTISTVWNRGIKPVFNAIKSAIGQVKKAFSDAATGIKNVWKKVRGYVKAPVTGVLNIYNHLIHAISKIPGLGSWDKKQTTKLGASVKKWRSGGWTGPGSRSTEAGIVHADEYVLSKPARRSLETQNPGALDYMNRTGQWPGYKKGGRVKPLRPMPTASQNFGPGHPAVDYPVPTGTAVYAIAPGKVTSAPKWNSSYGHHINQMTEDGFRVIYAHLSKIYAGAGRIVKAGQNIGRSGNTGNSTGPHLHLEIRSGGRHISPGEFLSGATKAKGGKALNPISMLKSIVNIPKKLKGWIKNNVSGVEPMGHMFVDTAKKIGSSVWDWMKDKAASWFGSDSNSGGTAGTKKVRDWIQTALSIAGLPTTDRYINAWTSQAMTESSGNPKAVQTVRDINWPHNKARGLLQVIPTTFARWHKKGLNDPFNPIHSAVAGMRYARATYGVKKMLDVIGHGHGYATGSLSARSGLSWVGERGPELVNFRGGERVYNNRQSGNIGGETRLSRDDMDYMIQGLGNYLIEASLEVSTKVARDSIDQDWRRSQAQQMKAAAM